MTNKELWDEIQSYYKGRLNEDTMLAILQVLVRLGSEDREKVLTRVAFMVFDSNGLAISLPFPKQFSYLVILNPSAEKKLVEIVAHEVAHVLLGHCDGPNEFDSPEQNHQQELAVEEWCVNHGFEWDPSPEGGPV